MGLIIFSTCWQNRILFFLCLFMSAVTLSSCNMATTGDLYEGIVIEQPEYGEISAMREYRSCLSEARLLDEVAQKVAMSARYIASAKLLEKCEKGLNAVDFELAKEERYRAGALSTQNFLKGGDIESARKRLAWLETNFPNTDLYFVDGSSFIETMSILLNSNKESALTVANVSSEFRAEIRRISYWRNN